MRFYPRRLRLGWVGIAITFGALWLSVVSGIGGPPLNDAVSSKLGPGLSQLMAATEVQTDAASSPSLSALWIPGTRPEELQAGQVRVTVIAQGMDDVPAVMDRVRTLAGTVETRYQTWVQALVPVRVLVQLLQLPQVRVIRLPDIPHLDEVISQGVGISGADVWQKAGFTGKGVKVAIVDRGFRGYRDLLGKELPPTVITKSFRSDGQVEPNTGSDSDMHGLAVAEIVHDMAPDAQLFLVAQSTEVEFLNALDWVISQKVDVLNLSLGFSTGCYLGNGSLDDPVFFSDNQGQIARLRKTGILPVVSAGNRADSHWGGTWQDQDNNGELNFAPSDNADTFEARKDDPIWVDLSWDDNPCFGATDDYDLFLEDGSGTILASSTDRQLGRNNDFSSEAVFLKAPYTGTYKIVVKQISAKRAVKLDLFLSTTPDEPLTHAVAAGSLVEPAISANAMTVGAMDAKNLTLEPFSSQGPTLDGRVKPDISGVDDVATVTFNPDTFFGTSASAPQVAGAAALVKQAFPNFGPDQIQQYLEQHAEDLGSPGKDNQYGAGLLIMGAVPTNAPAVPAPPSDLKANALSVTAIHLTWKSNSNNETGFQIERRLQAGDFTMIGSTQANATSFTDTGLSPATIYCYRVRATNQAGSSNYSNEACATTVVQAPSLQVDPKSLSFSATEGASDPAAQTLRITNASGGTLNWQATVSADAPWLRLGATAGTAPSSVQVTAALAGLAPGTYQGRISITAVGASNSPVNVPITLALERKAPPTAGELLALKFKQLEFVNPGDWERTQREGCVVYKNVSKGPSLLRVTLPDTSVREFKIPAGKEVLVCGDVVHIDTR